MTMNGGGPGWSSLRGSRVAPFHQAAQQAVVQPSPQQAKQAVPQPQQFASQPPQSTSEPVAEQPLKLLQDVSRILTYAESGKAGSKCLKRLWGEQPPDDIQFIFISHDMYRYCISRSGKYSSDLTLVTKFTPLAVMDEFAPMMMVGDLPKVMNFFQDIEFSKSLYDKRVTVSLSSLGRMWRFISILKRTVVATYAPTVKKIGTHEYPAVPRTLVLRHFSITPQQSFQFCNMMPLGTGSKPRYCLWMSCGDEWKHYMVRHRKKDGYADRLYQWTYTVDSRRLIVLDNEIKLTEFYNKYGIHSVESKFECENAIHWDRVRADHDLKCGIFVPRPLQFKTTARWTWGYSICSACIWSSDCIINISPQVPLVYNQTQSDFPYNSNTSV